MAYVKKQTTYSNIELVDKTTGESHGEFSTNTTETSEYATIRNINFKGNIMDLFNYQAMICKSANDIEAFGTILDSIDKNNRLILNQAEYAKRHNINKSRLSRMLKTSVDVSFMKKIINGVYEVNPFVFLSKGLANGKYKDIEELQSEW